MAARKHLELVVSGLIGALATTWGCVLPGYEMTGDASGTGASASGGAGGGTGGGAGGGTGGGAGGGGGGSSCVDRPPPCELNSDGNCGHCGRACDASAPCIDDLCPVADVDDGEAWFMAHHDHLLYWTEGNPIAGTEGAVKRLDLLSGESQVLGTSVYAPTDISVDATHVLWVEPDANGIVFREPHDASGAESLFSGFLDGANSSTGVATSEDFLFFGIDGFDGSIQRGPYDGDEVGPHNTFANAGYPEDLIVHGEHLYWTTRGQVNSDAPAGLWRRSLAGGDVETLHETQGNQDYGELVIQGGHAYWVSMSGVLRVPLAGPFPVDAPEPVSNTWATGVAADDGAVYWVEHQASRIMKRPKFCDGWGDPVVLYEGSYLSRHLAIGDGRVFFSDNTQILSLPK